jgi:hypothetical protein
LAKFGWQDITIDMYRVLVEASVLSRYIRMSEEHRSIIDASVLDINDEINEDKERYFVEIREVTNYARLHHEHLLDATTIIELALWKAINLHSRDGNQGLTRVEYRTDAGRCAFREHNAFVCKKGQLNLLMLSLKTSHYCQLLGKGHDIQ